MTVDELIIQLLRMAPKAVVRYEDKYGDRPFGEKDEITGMEFDLTEVVLTNEVKG